MVAQAVGCLLGDTLLYLNLHSQNEVMIIEQVQSIAQTSFLAMTDLSFKSVLR